MLFLDPSRPLPAAQTPYQMRVLNFCQQWQAEETSFLLRTSGSTGIPKPIQLTRSQMIASAILTGQTFGLQSGDRALCCLDVQYVAGMMMLVRALELKLSVVVVEPSTAPLKEWPTEWDLHFAAFTPLQLHTIVHQSSNAQAILRSAKAILVGGAPVSVQLEAELQHLEAPLFATYGMTETVSHVAIRRINGTTRSDAFRVLNGVEAGADERGCLWVRGGMTDFALIQTNDLVEWVDTRQFRWMGRFDSIINSGGLKIQPERVEAIVSSVLLAAGMDARFFVMGLRDERLGQCVGLISEGGPLAAEIRERIQSAVEAQVSRYAVPRRWLSVLHFDETATGKLDKRATLQSLGEYS
ncbi:MAG: AMP-binding protein [Sphingobacteriaceae bacterium]|nr:AMP-binding protein [Cytophagaceae bacterium]